MFWLGLIVGAVLAMLAVWFMVLYEEAAEARDIYLARRDIRDIERDTAQRMLAVALAEAVKPQPGRSALPRLPGDE